jgi:AcrR family transcriptional regulator
MIIPVVKTSTSERPMRADAARNRAKVLAAARRTFADEGLEAEVADIAKRAGVGVGTVYRHFPTKVALLTALTEEHLEQLIDITERSMEQGGTAWEMLERLIWEAAGSTADDHGMCEVLSNKPKEAGALPAAKRLRELHGKLVESAIAEGSMRDDATIDDIPTMMCGFGRVAAAQRDGSPMEWRRYLRLMLDGLHAR